MNAGRRDPALADPLPISPLPSGVRLAHRDATCAIGTFSELLVSVWGSAPTAVQISALRRAQQRVLAFPDPIAGIVVVLGMKQLSLPDEQVRKEAATIYDAVRGRKDVTAVAIESQGFVSAATRAFMSGVALLSGTSNPQKIFDSRVVAIEWVASKLSTPGRVQDPKKLLTVVNAVVAQVAPAT